MAICLEEIETERIKSVPLRELVITLKEAKKRGGNLSRFSPHTAQISQNKDFSAKNHIDYPEYTDKHTDYSDIIYSDHYSEHHSDYCD